MSETRVLLDPTTNRTRSLNQAELEETTVRQASEMRLAPQSLTVDVSGASSVRLIIDDPNNLISSGQVGVRFDSEISEDGGQTWRPHGIDPFWPGTQRSAKSGQYFVEERAVVYEHAVDAEGHAIVTSAPTVFPAGWRFRWHWRQTAPGRLGCHAELER